MRRLGLLFLLAANLAVGGEYAVFASGARLHVDRHEADGAKVRLYHDGGFVEMDRSAIKAYEQDELTPPAPPVAATPSPSPAVPEQPQALNPAELADAAADKYGLPRSLVRSVMAAESGFQSQAVSPKGAIGLMQLMPGTAQELGADPYDPAQNVDAGTRYLRSLLERYNGALWHALAAYNAGAGAVERYHGVPPYRETINYIGRIQRKMDSAEANR
jgi:soluble lytic murein transglycosylase-like protein